MMFTDARGRRGRRSAVSNVFERLSRNLKEARVGLVRPQQAFVQMIFEVLVVAFHVKELLTSRHTGSWTWLLGRIQELAIVSIVDLPIRTSADGAVAFDAQIAQQEQQTCRK